MNEERCIAVTTSPYLLFCLVKTHTYRLPFKIGLIAVEYMLPIFYATIADFEDC
jgi:hypothetical protein